MWVLDILYVATQHFIAILLRRCSQADAYASCDAVKTESNVRRTSARVSPAAAGRAASASSAKGLADDSKPAAVRHRVWGCIVKLKCARGSFLVTPEHTNVAYVLVDGLLPCLGVDKNDPRAHPVLQSDFSVHSLCQVCQDDFNYKIRISS